MSAVAAASAPQGDAPGRLTDAIPRMPDSGREVGLGQTAATFAGQHIADAFSEATVLFCDLVSFTAWSATQTPSSVFSLLEDVFSSFDAAARSHNVFKGAGSHKIVNCAAWPTDTRLISRNDR